MKDYQDLQRVSLITRYYDALQGLKLVVLGVFSIFAWINGLVRTKQGDLSILIPLLIAMVIAYMAADQYYKNKFGHVKKRRSIVEFLSIILVLGIIFLAEWADNSLNLTVSLPGLAIAVFSFWVWATTERFRHQYFVMAIVITAVSLSSLLLGNWINLSLNQGDGILIFGIVCTIGGFIDHLILVQSFPAKTESIE